MNGTPLLNIAQYSLVHQAPGGAGALAPIIGVSTNTLSNKVNPNLSTHHLSVNEALALMLSTADFSVLQALATETNHAVVPLPNDEMVSDAALLESYADLHKEFGDVAKAMSDSLKKDRITKKHVDIFNAEALEVISALVRLKQRFASLCDTCE